MKRTNKPEQGFKEQKDRISCFVEEKRRGNDGKSSVPSDRSFA